MNQSAAIVRPVGTEAMADHAWEEYRQLLIRHRAEPARYDDADRRKEREETYARFEAAFIAFNTAQVRGK